MNFRKGFFRLWLIGSMAFASIVAAVHYSAITEAFSEAEGASAATTQGMPSSGERAIDKLLREDAAYRYAWRLVLQTSAIAIGIPIAVFVGGVALGWALAGFRSNSSSS
jgi:hypothetical protein